MKPGNTRAPGLRFCDHGLRGREFFYPWKETASVLLPGKANVILKMYVLNLTLRFNWDSLFYLAVLPCVADGKVGSGQGPCTSMEVMMAGCGHWSTEVLKDNVTVASDQGIKLRQVRR